ncbi:protoporphyrinogen oxidase [Parambassis ranga]|uniref:Protoporphyrinogen oxidase n=1 Tax=Parambassis ranga TaxID=210632 RepID=A0A6P7JX96_9TELE|nr:protoporphyrinogen oxidase [Parambassis ranga]XP_028281272.1 protoporphyrinogen oxidase [Parambassis ranga]XP_028281274.1 protoporphyrinogen oxidase [Parambassis ranga]XP_028281275.1 protoporphyrinogen oxidase [Parambassis ranga]
MTTVAVLGGGIGGLAASYYLCKNPQVTKVIVLESSSRFGGWLWSTRRSDGAIFEHGPRGIRPAGAVGRNTLNMVEDLGLSGEILPVTYSDVASKNRYLYVNGRLCRMPSGISGIVRTVSPFSRPILLSMLSEIFVKKSKQEDESIHSFVSRRLGAELADIAVDSLCRGVFAGDCRKLSIRSCFPPLYKAEQHRGSLTLGLLLGSGPSAVVPPGALAQRSVKESWAQWSLKRGVESFPECITEYLQQSGRVQLHRDAAVTQIQPSASGWKIRLEGDGVVSADHVIAALPAKALSSVLPPSCQPLIQQLQDISTVTVAVVNLEYDGDSLLPVVGFGHLLPSSEDPGLLGIVYDSVAFPQQNKPNGQTTRLTVMMGGAWFQEAFGSPEAVTEERLLARATEAVQRHLGISAAPCWSKVALHQDCIPQYHLGHFSRVESMRAFIRKNDLALSLIGASYDGVSVNDVIFSGRTAVQELLS